MRAAEDRLEAVVEGAAVEAPLVIGRLREEVADVVHAVALQLREPPRLRQRDPVRRLLHHHALAVGAFRRGGGLLVPARELLEREPAVAVGVRLLERLLRRDGSKLVGRRAHRSLRVGLQLVQHLEHGREVRRHLLQRDEAIAVVVVQRERRAHLLVAAAAAQHAEPRRELLEVEHAVAVGVEHREEPLERGGGVAATHIRAQALEARAEGGVGDEALVVRRRGEELEHLLRAVVGERRESAHLLEPEHAVAAAAAAAAAAAVVLVVVIAAGLVA